VGGAVTDPQTAGSDNQHIRMAGSTMLPFIRTRIDSFRNAFSGLWYVIHTQRNTWIHLVITILVIAGGFLLRISRTSWGLIVLAMGLVWMAEFLNTALEALVDLASPQKHPLAKIGKDVGAAAVLVAAASAVIIGLITLGPPLLQWLIKIQP
jgi:diacylglycerol kinase